jgi:hypothetical protein
MAEKFKIFNFYLFRPLWIWQQKRILKLLRPLKCSMNIVLTQKLKMADKVDGATYVFNVSSYISSLILTCDSILKSSYKMLPQLVDLSIIATNFLLARNLPVFNQFQHVNAFWIRLDVIF